MFTENKNNNLFHQDPLWANTQENEKSSSASTETAIQGHVLRIIFTSQDGSYSVAKIRDNAGQEIILIGPLLGIAEGQDLTATGRWEKHKEYGMQLRITECHPILPTTEEGIIQYLSSGVLPGIGQVYAKRIVQYFGAKTLTILDQYSERLKEVPGVGKKRVSQIRDAWHKNTSNRENLIYLQGLGISIAYAWRIIQKYLPHSPADIIQNNPYRLITDIHGIGFLTADRIAAKMKIEKNHPKRLCAGIVYCLDELASRGNTCFPQGQLLLNAAKILHVTPDEIAEGLQIALSENKIIQKSFPNINYGLPYLYLRSLAIAEKDLAQTTYILLHSPPEPCSYSPQMQQNNDIQLNAGQQQAVHFALQHSCSIITGGPGVGKTTVVSCIVKIATALNLKVMLTAPTGRAAKRLAEATDMRASTIHRLLKWDPQKNEFAYNADKPLTCEVLVVDEASMLDTSLANHLFQAIHPGTRLILVGDKDQLPSVGPGCVLHDFIECELFPVTHLTEIYRQAQGSRIIMNAHAVNHGTMPNLQPPNGNQPTDFYWIEQDDPEIAADLICKMVAERIPKAFGFDPMNDVQILSPMRKGVCGVTALNQRLQEALNPLQNAHAENQSFTFGSREFRVGDRVMQLSNNYDKKVFNGDMGRILRIDSSSDDFTVLFDSSEVTYAQNEADQLSLAYAVTVHKSQGCEFPVVLMPVLSQHYVMLQRNLIYTGMTRAKKLLIMVGSRRALGIAVRNNEPMQRISLLIPHLHSFGTA